MAAVYRITNLTKIYKNSSHRANDQLTFDIYEGEIFGLLGPNGAGKSTLLHQIVGLVRPTSGNIELFGMDVVRNPDLIRHYVALQPQQTTALQDLYPEEALSYTARCRGIATAEARRQTDALMEELQLDQMRRKQIRTLSGGQRKLISLAVAFIGNRPVQIFDEPTNELDPELRRLIWDKLLQIHRQGITIILVTHNVLEAERVIQRVGMITHGRLIALGSPGEMKARIDQRIRLELRFKVELPQDAIFLEGLGEAHRLARRHWIVLCSRTNAQATINQILSQVGLDRLDDFRILTPSLEDVYLQLRGDSEHA